jgi:phage-related protein
MSRSPVINVTVTGDASGLDRAFKKAADGVNGFGGSLKRVFNEKLIGGGISLIADAAAGVVDFGKQGIEQFDALGDAAALIDANFSGLSKTVEGLDLTKLGFDKVEAATAAKDISNAAAALGLTKTQAESMVPALTQAAAGYSALTGKTPQEAGALLAKALGGSAKAAKELGIEFTATMTPADRVNAIMAKYGPLATEAATGTRSLADEQATFDAQMSNLSTTFGGFLSSALTPVMQALNDTFFPLLAQFSTDIGPGVTEMMSVLGSVFSGVAAFIKESVVPIVKRLTEAIGKALTPVLEDVGPALQPWITLFGELFDFIAKNVVPILVDSVVPILGTLLGLIVDVAGAVGGALLTAFRAMKSPLEKFFGLLQSVWKVLRDVINGIANAPIVKDFLNFVGGDGGGSGRSAPAGASTVNVYVSGADPQAVVGALRKYERTTGHGLARALR